MTTTLIPSKAKYANGAVLPELTIEVRKTLLNIIDVVGQDVKIADESSTLPRVAAATIRQCLDATKQVALSDDNSDTVCLRKLATASQRVRALLRRQNDQFLAVPWKAVPRAWRCCSTDATIVLVCAEIILLDTHATTSAADPSATTQSTTAFSDSRQISSRILGLIRSLDECLIVTGAPGDGRSSLIHHLIHLLQSLYQSIPSPPADPIVSTSEQATTEPAAKRARLSYKREQEPQPGPVRATQDVLELAELPGLLDFLNNHIDRPFIVRGWADGWPALQPDEESDEPRSGPRWSCGTYLTRLVGPGRVVPVEIGRAYTDAEWTQAMIPWEDFLQRAGWILDPPQQPPPLRSEDKEQDGPTTYLAQHTLLTQFPELEADMIRPDLVYSCPPAPSWMPEYRAPVNTEGGETEDVVVNAWIGPGGTLSPAHTDPYYNLFVQVVGHKQFWLAPPEANERGGMYQFSDTDASQAVTEQRQSGLPASSQVAASYMDNTSQLDVFAPPTSDGDPSEDAFPLFTKQVEPLALKAVVGPGDLLYIPPMWWHAVRSLSKSISISHFF
ncbi:hypothetical protein OC845_001468 [Tilletia horrida]|nr:hypothetical protein OC845_001468 [Tilletia horrida]